MRRSMIARDVLAYLTAHPDARDTIEGIIRWWIPEQKIKTHITTLKNVIAELVAKGLILESHGHDSRIHYRINRQKIEEIEDFFQNKTARVRRKD